MIILANHHLATTLRIINSGKKQQMLKLVGENGTGDGISHSSKISPHNIYIFLTKKKKSYHIVEKQGRYHINQVTKFNTTLS